MTLFELLSALGRHRALFLTVLVLSIGATVAVTLALPKTYRAKAVLSVAPPGDALVDPSSVEQLTRTYTTLAGNLNVVDAVRRRLTGDMSRADVLDSMSFAPVERTQLFEIAADSRSPDRARLLANVYARTFAERVSPDAGLQPRRASVAVAEPAALPTSPVRPNPPLYIGFGAVLSLLLAVGAVALRARTDQRIDVDETEDTVLGHPVIGRIPERHPRGRNELEFTDAFRVLKTNMDFATKAPLRVVAVTSPGPVEGKTSIALNLAETLAAGGESTILIEGDMRRPGLDRVMGAAPRERSHKGLADLLHGAADVDEVVTRDFGGLDIIWAGAVSSTSSIRFSFDGFGQLVAELADRYDRVVIDTPPVFAGADASVIGASTDAVIYILDLERTKLPAARSGLNQLRKANIPVAGVVLNRATTPTLGDYYSGRRAFGPPPRAVAPVEGES